MLISVLAVLFSGCDLPLPDPEWHTVTDDEFRNDWHQMTIYDDLQYWKDGYGTVHIRGYASDTSPVSSNEDIFILPEECRPENNMSFDVRLRSDLNWIDDKINVFSNGRVQCQGATSVDIVCFDDIVFVAAY